MAGESVSTRQLSERLGNARTDAGLRHPTEALASAAACRARRRRRRLQSAVQRAHKHRCARARATCTGGSVPMATPVIDPPLSYAVGGSGGGILMTGAVGGRGGKDERTCRPRLAA